MSIKHGSEKSGVGHETRDTSIRALVIFGIGLFVSLVLVLLLSSTLFHYLAGTQSLGPPASPFANARSLPPQPQLQVEPREDLQRYREAQNDVLKSYGWVDQSAGVVRIPIDRAMTLLAQRGLPVRGQPPGKAGRP